MLREEDSVCPGWNFSWVHIVCYCALVVLVGWVEEKLAFLIRLEHFTLHAVHIKLVLSHHRLIVLLLYQAYHVGLGHGHAEVQITKEHLNIVILNLVAMVLSTSLPLIDHLCNLIQLRVSLLNIPHILTSTQVAIQENKRAILESKSDRNSSLVSAWVGHWGFYCRHGNIENARLDLRPGDQENYEAVLVCLSD